MTALAQIRGISLALAITGLVAACNSTAVDTPLPVEQTSRPVYSSGAPFGSSSPPYGSSAPMAAYPASAPIERSSETRRVTVSPDGGTVRTTTTRTSVSVNPDAAVDAAASLLGGLANSGGGYVQGIPGMWRAQSSSTREICMIQLYGPPDAASGPAESTGCAYGGVLYEADGWRYAEGRLYLMKGGQTTLTMNQRGPNRYDGRLTLGILSTNIALFR